MIGYRFESIKEKLVKEGVKNAHGAVLKGHPHAARVLLYCQMILLGVKIEDLPSLKILPKKQELRLVNHFAKELCEWLKAEEAARKEECV